MTARGRAAVAVRLVVVAVLAGALSSGCGGPPRDASTEEFCAAWGEVTSALAAEEATPADVAAVQDALGALADVGTPQDAPVEARDGLEVLDGVVENIGDNASQEDLDQLDEAVGAADQDKVEALLVYAAQTCEPGAEQ